MNPSSNPSPQGSGVWLPMALADRLFSCYYGRGPRHASAQEEPLAEEIETPPSPPVDFNPATAAPSPIDLTRLRAAVGAPAGFKPRGIAAQTYPSGTKPPEGTTS
jgi:hypothetical protein